MNRPIEMAAVEPEPGKGNPNKKACQRHEHERAASPRPELNQKTHRHSSRFKDATLRTLHLRAHSHSLFGYESLLMRILVIDFCQGKMMVRQDAEQHPSHKPLPLLDTADFQHGCSLVYEEKSTCRSPSISQNP